jgi:hypothetical protein
VTVRWKFETLDGAETYTFEINPNTQSSPISNRDITWNYAAVRDGGTPVGYSGTRAPRAPKPWEFGGVVRSKEQYDAFIYWLNKKAWVRVTDDLGRQFIIRILSFEPAQEAGSGRRVPYRHTYTVRTVIKP